jgi:hypothetical protein
MLNSIVKHGRVAEILRSSMQGKVWLSYDEGYDEARAIWNGAVEHRPAVIARCESTRDIQVVLCACREQGLRVSVRGGGYDWAGRCLAHNGVVIDLSAMRRVTVDADARVATVAGGATGRDVIRATAPHDLAAVTGYCGSVGMAGLTLGGGYGPLNARHGLAADNLLRAQVVLASGQVVIADAAENPKLFWALRGGGGNFGVVTSMQIRLHRLREIVAGTILFPWSQAEAVLRGYAEVMAMAPDELMVTAGVLSGLNGSPLLFLAPAWCGEPDGAGPVMDVLQNLGTPIHTAIHRMSYSDLLGNYDTHYVVPGLHYAARTRWLAKLTPDAITALMAAGATRTSPYSVILLHYLHGAATRIADHDSAFGLRRNHFLVEVLAAWEPGPTKYAASPRLWAQNLSNVLAQDALPGGYPNLLGPDDHEQTASAYGCNLAALEKAKRRYDPCAVFSAIPLPTEREQATNRHRVAERMLT